MKESTYLSYAQGTRHPKESRFLARLAQIAVPIEELTVNDWENSKPRVIISTNYPRHKVRECRRFSERDLSNAIQWYLAHNKEAAK